MSKVKDTETETEVKILEGAKQVSIDVDTTTRAVRAAEPVKVTLDRAATAPTTDVALWRAIRAGTRYVSFDRYRHFVDSILMGRDPGSEFRVEKERIEDLLPKRGLPFPGVDAYRLVKVATEVFLMTHCGITGFEGFDDDEKLFPHAKQLPVDEKRVLSLMKSYLIPVTSEAEAEAVEGGTPGGTKTRRRPHNGEDHAAKDGDVMALPYLEIIQDKLRDVPLVRTRRDAAARAVQDCYFILQEKLSHPTMVELIWSYWHEEAMLVQTMNAICRRFQNKRANGERDPLMNLDIDPLRPLGNIFWGYLQDEGSRLTVQRRAYEYAHLYGLTLEGKAVEGVKAADTRSKFLEAFHNLLHRCVAFYKQDDDTTVKADGFPVLNALKEVHFVLAQGAHNQFGELPTNARQEMLMQQWILARPEIREFIGGRVMVPYTEAWMDRVDTMKQLMGWTDVSVLHFHDLATYGEQLLLSIRYGGWSVVVDMDSASNWARFWRAEVQNYIHSYRAVTGVDLTVGESVDATPPSVHFRRRLQEQQRRGTV